MEKDSRRTFKSLPQGLPHYIVLLMKQVTFFKNLKISTELVSTLLVFTYGIVFMTIPNITTVYPIGHDTSAYLGNLKLMYEINFKSNYIYAYPLLPFFFSILYSLGVNIVAFLKVYSILAYGVAGISVYYYARKGLNWEKNKSLLTGIIFLSSPIALRIGWELHSQFIATVLLFIALTQLSLLLKMENLTLKSVLRKRRFLLIIVLTIAIGWLHLLISALFLFILVFEFFINTRKAKEASAVYLLCAFALALSSSLSAILLAPEPMTLVNPKNLQTAIGFIRPEYANGISWLVSLILFSYAIIIPLAFFGIFKKSQVLLMTIFPTLFLVLFSVNPSLPFVPPERIVYLYVYPFSLFASNGVYRLKNYGRNLKIKLNVLKVFFSIDSIILAIVLALLIFQSLNMTGLFQPVSPLANPPSGYPQNLQWAGVSISEIGDVISVTEWYRTNMNFDSLLIVPDGAFGLVKYYLEERMPVVKWSVYYQPSANLLWLQNGSLFFMQVDMPAKMINDLFAQDFNNLYIMYMPSWNISNAYTEIYPRIENAVYQSGDVILYKIRK